MAARKVSRAVHVPEVVEAFTDQEVIQLVSGTVLPVKPHEHDQRVLRILISIVDACYEGTGKTQPWKSIRDDIEKLMYIDRA